MPRILNLAATRNGRATDDSVDGPLTSGDRLRNAITFFRVPFVIAGSLLLIWQMDNFAAYWWGMPIVVCGELIQLWSSAHIRKNTQFTASGPYAHVRNPMYLGRFVLVLGFFIMTGSVYLVAAYVVIFALYVQSRVKREEKRLERYFGEVYRHYCTTVNRWLPSLRPRGAIEPRRASWALACVNNEHLNLYATVAILALIYCRLAFLPPSSIGL